MYIIHIFNNIMNMNNKYEISVELKFFATIVLVNLYFYSGFTFSRKYMLSTILRSNTCSPPLSQNKFTTYWGMISPPLKKKLIKIIFTIINYHLILSLIYIFSTLMITLILKNNTTTIRHLKQNQTNFYENNGDLFFHDISSITHLKILQFVKS